MNERKFFIYEENGKGGFLKSRIIRDNGKRCFLHNEKEARFKCDQLKGMGINFKVKEVIDVTSEFSKY